MTTKQDDSDPLPYTQVDRSVKPKVALLAGALGVTTQHALGSLVEFWDLCGDPRQLEQLLASGGDAVVLKRDEVVRRFQLASGKTADADQLTSLGLLEPLANDQFRVRGMSRYLAPIRGRLLSREKARAGGLASAAARKAKKGSAQPPGSLEPGSGSASGRVEPAFEPKSNDRGLGSGRVEPPFEPAPNPPEAEVSGHRSAADQKKLAGLPAPSNAKTPDPRHGPLLRQLAAAGWDVAGGKNAKQATLLLQKGEPSEILSRASRARVAVGFPKVRTLAELVDKWGHFAADSSTKATGRGSVDPSTQKHTGGPLAL